MIFILIFIIQYYLKNKFIAYIFKSFEYICFLKLDKLNRNEMKVSIRAGQ